MSWDIRPYDGIGPLKFGMSPRQVAQILDPFHRVTAVHPVFDGSKNEFRSMDLPVCNYKSDKLHAIDTTPRVSEVCFDDIDLYMTDSRRVMLDLDRANGGARTDLGMVLFDKLGINTSGFFLTDEDRFFRIGADERDGRGIGVFQRGAFDAMLPGFKAISFSKM